MPQRRLLRTDLALRKAYGLVDASWWLYCVAVTLLGDYRYVCVWYSDFAVVFVNEIRLRWRRSVHTVVHKNVSLLFFE